jgi:hypothetical protein
MAEVTLELLQDLMIRCLDEQKRSVGQREGTTYNPSTTRTPSSTARKSAIAN